VNGCHDNLVGYYCCVTDDRGLDLVVKSDMPDLIQSMSAHHTDSSENEVL